MSSASAHRLACAWGFVLLRMTASVDMYDVGALVGWSLRAVGRHVDFFSFDDDDDDDALQWVEWRETGFSEQRLAFTRH